MNDNNMSLREKAEMLRELKRLRDTSETNYQNGLRMLYPIGSRVKWFWPYTKKKTTKRFGFRARTVLYPRQPR